IDLYLIHWPLPMRGAYVEAWRALIDLREEGVLGSIGVSNFLPEHLDRLRAESGELPVVNQVEAHPGFVPGLVEAAHRRLGIQTVAWSPLGRSGRVHEEPRLREIADRHGATVAQVVLRWHLRQGRAVVVKSADRRRQSANLRIFDLELTTREYAEVGASVDPRGRIGGDPETFEEL